ncbi:2,3-bisphosphoglycerate-dependent phosphoglycerate mutase [Paraburkholderia gardini]|uniref:2,3-bisphosphoglycerate-dependent phosphoglycerate mutase n=1 Tax=Paraburkholderia gardini TaxID=2823469 RepID=UPI001DC9FFF7|nr:2,3-bisphosphoglycerate-dependent phosphoglycerate mutase [Paraburkholderia gardini]CAG4897719.1 2,3-bisphosphoglycerate-dependent phosphoglycerate mutase [Paraburkholderia gardini]
MPDHATLVVLRHGQSVWNHANRFTGWTDVGLSEAGVEQARRVGEQLRDAGFNFDLAVTSALQRATVTLQHLVHALGEPNLRTTRSWRLNDRHYGALTGMEKAAAAAVFGVARVREWRRGFNIAPPPLDPPAQRELLDALHDASMSDLDTLPRTESLRDTLVRVLPLWEECVAPALQNGESVLMVAHGNSLRALFKHLDDIDDVAIASIEVAHAQPLVLTFDATLRITSRTPLDKWQIIRAKNAGNVC